MKITTGMLEAPLFAMVLACVFAYVNMPHSAMLTLIVGACYFLMNFALQMIKDEIDHWKEPPRRR